MNSPQNDIWGPSMWAILHYSVEQIGTRTFHKLPAEETRLWVGLLSSLRYSLPCPLCKKHYTDYFSINPIITVTREFIRIWLYSLHFEVNQRSNKSNIITIEQIPEIYNKPFNFSYHFNILNEHMTRSVRLGWSSRNDIHRTIRFLLEIKRFYDFF